MSVRFLDLLFSVYLANVMDLIVTFRYSFMVFLASNIVRSIYVS